MPRGRGRRGSNESVDSDTSWRSTSSTHSVDIKPAQDSGQTHNRGPNLFTALCGGNSGGGGGWLARPATSYQDDTRRLLDSSEQALGRTDMPLPQQIEYVGPFGNVGAHVNFANNRDGDVARRVLADFVGRQAPFQQQHGLGSIANNALAGAGGGLANIGGTIRSHHHRRDRHHRARKPSNSASGPQVIHPASQQGVFPTSISRPAAPPRPAPVSSQARQSRSSRRPQSHHHHPNRGSSRSPTRRGQRAGNDAGTMTTVDPATAAAIIDAELDPAQRLELYLFTIAHVVRDMVQLAGQWHHRRRFPELMASGEEIQPGDEAVTRRMEALAARADLLADRVLAIVGEGDIGVLGVDGQDGVGDKVEALVKQTVGIGRLAATMGYDGSWFSVREISRYSRMLPLREDIEALSKY